MGVQALAVAKALAVVVALATIPGSLSAQRPETRLSVTTRPAQAGAPRIAAAGAAAYVCWNDQEQSSSGLGSIRFARSVDAGATYVDRNRRLDGHTSPRALGSPAIAAVGPDVFVAWADNRTGAFDVWIRRSTDVGQTFANAIRLSHLPTGRVARDLQITANGNYVYVVWADERNGLPTIYCNRSIDGGRTWQPSATRIASGPLSRSASLPQVVARENAVCIAWRDARNGAPDIYAQRSLDGGRTWLPQDVRLNTDPAGRAFADQPCLAFDGNTVHAVWTDGRSGSTDIHSNRSLDFGRTWLTRDVRIDTDLAGAATSEAPTLAAANGMVLVAWQDSRDGATDIRYNRSTDRGATFQAADARLDTGRAGAAASFSPQVTRIANRVFATWVETSSGQPNIAFNRSTDDGKTWLPWHVELERNPAGAVAPTVAAVGAAVYVAWCDRRHNGADVYANVPFGWLPNGAGKAGAGGAVPLLVSFEPATIGTRPHLVIASGRGAAPGLLLVGAGPASRVAVPWLGGTLRVLPTLSLPLTLRGALGQAGVGTAVVPVDLPNNPSLLGQNINFQALFVDAAASFGVSFSNGVALWIG